MQTGRVRWAFSVAACVVAVAACGTGDADDTTRNLFVPTTKPVVPTTRVTTPVRAASTTTGPPPATLPGGGVSANELLCVPTGVSGQFTPSTVTLPGRGGQTAGVAVNTSCDPSRPPTAVSPSTPSRVFVVEAPPAPAIRSIQRAGELDVRIVDGRRSWRQPIRVVTSTMPVTSAMRSNRLVASSLEVRITQRENGGAPDAPSATRQQTTQGSTRVGVFDADSAVVVFQVRWAAQERREGTDIYRRSASAWSNAESVDLESDRPPDPFVMVAFGDSYGSGEGNPALPMPRYLPGCWGFWAYEDACINLRPFEDSRLWDFHEVGANELVWGTATDCHRSSESGVAKAVEQLHEEWNIPRGSFFFGHFACSGAKSQHIVNTSYRPDWTDGFPCGWTNPGQSGRCFSMPPQITHARSWLASHRLDPQDVDVVLVSIGGNNAGFADLVASCFVLLDVCNDTILADPSAINTAIRVGAALAIPVAGLIAAFFVDDVIPTWRRAEKMQALRNALRSVATAARDAFPRASIMFTTYTDGISVNRSNPADRDRDGACSEADYTRSSPYSDDWNWTISAQSARWLQGVMREINATIKDEVSRMQRDGFPVQVVSEQTDNHTNNGFCTGLANSSIVFSDEAAVTQGDDISDLLDLSSGGWHPSDLGYQFYGRAIAKAINANINFARTWPMYYR